MVGRPYHQEETYTKQHQDVDVRLRSEGHQNLNPRVDHRDLNRGANNHIQIQDTYRSFSMDMIKSSDEDDLPEEIPQHDCKNLFGESYMKNEIFSFSGYISIEKVLQWLYKVENFFEYVSILEEQKLRFVAYKFRDGAAA